MYYWSLRSTLTKQQNLHNAAAIPLFANRSFDNTDIAIVVTTKKQ